MSCFASKGDYLLCNIEIFALEACCLMKMEPNYYLMFGGNVRINNHRMGTEKRFQVTRTYFALFYRIELLG